MRAITPEGLRENVVAVPPVAWTQKQELDWDQNRRLVRHIEQGGVTHLLYGGNANLYHFSSGQLSELVQMLAEIASPETCVIPSIGSGFGKMLDDAQILRKAGFNSAMILPTTFPIQPDGVATAIRRTADAFGNGLIAYIKSDNYLDAATIGQLVDEGAVTFVKYAVERTHPENDEYLTKIVSTIGTHLVGSGMGETPLRSHFPIYNLSTYTSGGVCIAPKAASSLRKSFRDNNVQTPDQLMEPFLDFERVRSKYNGMSVIHGAISLAGIAEMGPVLPMLCEVPTYALDEVRRVVDSLTRLEKSLG